MPEKNRIPSLDGARAISIALVMVFHANWQRQIPGFNLGLLGVRAFFIISGFLITVLLVAEQEVSGIVNVRQFYIRRAFRVLQAAYVYVAITAALVPFGMHFYYKDIPSVLFYYANYHLHFGDNSGIALDQFWSLSVEEQFYLLWPVALALSGVRRSRYVCVILILIAPAFRLLSFHGIWPTNPNFAFESVCDALATGCLLALLRDKLWNSGIYRAIVGSAAIWVFSMCAFILTCTAFPFGVQCVVGIRLLNFSIAGLLDRYMRFPEATAVGHILNSRSFVWVGKISYSLYVWQQPWMFTAWRVNLRVIGALACAILSFYFVERPMLRMRGWIMRVDTSRPVRRQVLKDA